MDNLWRPSNASYRFYSCAKPTSSDSCLRPNGTCKDGYRGPRCSVCAEGWGKEGTYCIRCRAHGAVVGLMMLFVVIALAFVSILVYTSFTMKLSETLPVLLRIAISHLQIASRLNDIIDPPQALIDLFDVFLQLSELIRFDIVSSECPPLKLTVYGRFYMVICTPFGAMLFFGCVYFGLFIYRKIKGVGPQYVVVEPPPGAVIRRDRVMMIVARFIGRVKGAAAKHHGDVARDDLREQYYTSFHLFRGTAVIILFPDVPIRFNLVRHDVEVRRHRLRGRGDPHQQVVLVH